MIRIAIKHSAGGVAIMTVRPDVDPAQEVARWEAGNAFGWTVVEWKEIPEDDVPSRDFRNAYELNGKSVALNMEKARDLHKAGLRLARAPILQSLDVDYMRADEAGDDAEKARIAERKQELRDVTKDPRIASAKSPADLLAVTLP